MGIRFDIQLKPVNEAYPNHLKAAEISDYLSELKAKPFLSELEPDELLITSDTIVWHMNKALGKPKDRDEALEMLMSLSNNVHEVITSVCLTTTTHQRVFHDMTRVTFKDLKQDEIEFYIDNYKPFDKAGAYGIQEWIGAIGISKIEGSYNNVVGLPTQKLYETLKTFLEGR
jgi:septum formation protein